MSKLIRIKEALSAWTQSRSDVKAVKKLLEKGSFFLMDTTDEKDLSAYVKQKLFAYVGVENGEIIFILVPDTLDEKSWDSMTPAELDAVKIKSFKADYDEVAKDFLENPVDGPDISVSEALKRHHRWQIARDAFLTTEVESPKGLFELIVMPYANIKAELSRNDVDELCCSFGLNRDTKGVSESGYCADMVAWSVMADGSVNTGSPYNSHYPTPPFEK